MIFKGVEWVISWWAVVVSGLFRSSLSTTGVSVTTGVASATGPGGFGAGRFFLSVCGDPEVDFCNEFSIQLNLHLLSYPSNRPSPVQSDWTPLTRRSTFSADSAAPLDSGPPASTEAVERDASSALSGTFHWYSQKNTWRTGNWWTHGSRWTWTGRRHCRRDPCGAHAGGWNGDWARGVCGRISA